MGFYLRFLLSLLLLQSVLASPDSPLPSKSLAPSCHQVGFLVLSQQKGEHCQAKYSGRMLKEGRSGTLASPQPSDFSLSKRHLFCDLLLLYLQSPEVAGFSILRKSELKNWVRRLSKRLRCLLKRTGVRIQSLVGAGSQIPVTSALWNPIPPSDLQEHLHRLQCIHSGVCPCKHTHTQR